MRLTAWRGNTLRNHSNKYVLILVNWAAGAMREEKEVLWEKWEGFSPRLGGGWEMGNLRKWCPVAVVCYK